MPTISVNVKRISKLVGKSIKPEEMEKYLTNLGTAVEKIEGDMLELEVFPNRPDLLSEEGIARALRYYLDLQKGFIAYAIKKAKEKVIAEKNALNIRPYVRMFMVKGVEEFSFEGLIQLQEKLHVTHGRRRKAVSIGVHDASAITFPVYYKAVDKNYSFIPLGWDREATIEEILHHHEKGIKYGHLLSNTSLYPIWEDSKGKVLALPPIINGIYTAVSENTKDFLVDVTGIDERKVDEITRILVAHFYELSKNIEEISINGTYFINMSYKPKQVSEQEIKDYLGTDLNVSKALMRMGIVYEKETAYIPPYRTDILHPIDVIEDVAIGYGYDNFDPVIPEVYGIGEEQIFNRFERTLRHIFSGMGALEIKNYHLTNSDIAFTKMLESKNEVVEVENPMNQEYYMLRPSLLSLLLNNLQHNKLYEYPQFVFEIGDVFEGIKERRSFAFVYVGKDASFSKAKGIMTRLLGDLGLEASYSTLNKPFFIEGRGAFLDTAKFEGYFGEIHPQVIMNFDLELPVIGGEFKIKK